VLFHVELCLFIFILVPAATECLYQSGVFLLAYFIEGDLVKEKEAGKISMDTVEELLNDPDIIPVEAPLNANVWKVEVKEGDAVKLEQVVSILEAMKLEIPVKAEQSMEGATVEKLLVKPNDVVSAGKPLMLLRRSKKA